MNIFDWLVDSEHVDARDRDRKTRLIRAAETGDIQSVRKLVAKGADVSLMDRGKVTARIAAKRNGHKEIEEYLSILEGGPKPAEILAEKARLAFESSEAVKKLRAQKESELAEEEAVWFYSNDLEAREGPISFIALRKLLEEDSISNSTLVWSPEIKDWKTLHDVIEKYSKTSVDKNTVQSSDPLSAEKENLEHSVSLEQQLAKPVTSIGHEKKFNDGDFLRANKPPGMKWSIFWAYVYIPIVSIVSVLLALGAYVESNLPVFFVNLLFLVAYIMTAIGLHFRKLSAYFFNWFIIYTTIIGFSGGFVFGFSKSLKEVNVHLPLEVNIVIGLLIFGPLLYVNNMYWSKRKYLFISLSQ